MLRGNDMFVKTSFPFNILMDSVQKSSLYTAEDNAVVNPLLQPVYRIQTTFASHFNFSLGVLPSPLWWIKAVAYAGGWRRRGGLSHTRIPCLLYPVYVAPPGGGEGES
jgi:hypothetical protein